jgi:hypothetical protein
MAYGCHLGMWEVCCWQMESEFGIRRGLPVLFGTPYRDSRIHESSSTPHMTLLDLLTLLIVWVSVTYWYEAVIYARLT